MKKHINIICFIASIFINVLSARNTYRYIQAQDLGRPRHPSSVKTHNKEPEGEALAPYYVAIFTNERLVCGGAIIEYSFVLTAASCVDGGTPSDFQVKVGQPSGGLVVRVCSIQKHSLYKWSSQENDIAVVQLCRRLRFTNHIQPILVEAKRKHIETGSLAVESGTDSLEGNNKFKIVQVNIVEHVVCRNVYRSTVLNITDNMLCAARPEDDFCQGNFGAPLVINKELIGILSWSEGCNQKKYPEVYTRLANYYEWMEETLLSY